ncbi:MAG: peptide antibiotic transporter SbmA [Devosia sp.]|nr:peptide antibiotic transporter SbmA [Devosia sp.]
MFRSFFPEPRVFFTAAILWTALAMLVWFSPLGSVLEGLLSLGPWLGIKPTAADPTPFLDTHKVWLYEYIVVLGYVFCIPWYIFGGNRRWYWWSVIGSVTIVEFVYFDVQISAWLNSWYGGFYDLIQSALGKPNSVTVDNYFNYIWSVAIVLAVDVVFAIGNNFLNSHFLFRWRRAMSFYYMANWRKLRGIEGAAQRIQDDTQQFASILENLGLTLVSSVMTLIVFVPLLWTLSQQIKVYPIIGSLDGGLVWIAVLSALFGTVLLASVGIRLPGLTFQNQRVEAAYRKELVLGEDYADRAQPPSIRELFINMQGNYFRLYFHYLYFNMARYTYLNGSQFIPYIAMGPAIVTGMITLGVFQKVLDAFGQVSDSLRFLVNSWTSVINLISIYQRLRGFESNIGSDAIYANDYDDPAFRNSGEGGVAIEIVAE